MAGSFRQDHSGVGASNVSAVVLDKLFQTGPVLFSIMLILFGYSHFIYTEFVATLVPSWCGMAHFWTLFTETTLIASGLAIIFRIFPQTVAYLLALMLILWMVLLHVPRAIADPYSGNGNEIGSAFDALLFCGVALVIGAGTTRTPIDHIN